MRFASVLLLAVGLVNLLPGLAGLLPSATGRSTASRPPIRASS
jgi:hypothetical protein